MCRDDIPSKDQQPHNEREDDRKEYVTDQNENRFPSTTMGLVKLFTDDPDQSS